MLIVRDRHGPDRPGQFPLILFGHWMMRGSPLRNHGEFLDEAILYARAGAICVLLDSPLVREGIVEDPDWRNGQEAKAGLQMACEWRRALDILLVRKDVDQSRIAYVGHSFNAAVGARLAGVEKRIQSFVLMPNTYSLRDFVYDEENADIVGMCRKRVKRGYKTIFANSPGDLPERIVRKSFELFQEPKQIEFYEAGHALNAAARVDRAKWLQARLKLTRVDLRAIGSIEQLR